MANPINISAVNKLQADQFVWMFKNVIELRSHAAVQVEKERPFASLSELCDAFTKYLDALTVNEKVGVLLMFPDLAGRLAVAGKLSREFTSEQKSAGLDRLTADQKIVIDSLNERHKDKFGFSFVVCARENNIYTVIEGLQLRYSNTRAQEILTGIEEVKKICTLRVMDLVKDA